MTPNRIIAVFYQVILSLRTMGWNWKINESW
jgi:hypothetical protein